MAPYQMQLVSITSQGESYLCGGAILNSTTMLLPAHCLISRISRDFRVLDPTGTLTRLHTHNDITIHPSYNPNISTDYDICIVTTVKLITMAPSGPNKPATLSAIVPALGDQVNSVMQDTLSDSMADIPKYFCKDGILNVTVTDNQVCVSAPWVLAGSCDGGPLVNVKGEVIGLVSDSAGCTAPSIYTLIGLYLEWITGSK